MPLKTYLGALLLAQTGGLAVADECCACDPCDPCLENDTPTELWDNLQLTLEWGGQQWVAGGYEIWTNEDRCDCQPLYETTPNNGIRWDININTSVTYGFDLNSGALVVGYGAQVILTDPSGWEFNRTLIFQFGEAAGKCPHTQSCGPPATVRMVGTIVNAGGTSPPTWSGIFPNNMYATLLLEQP